MAAVVAPPLAREPERPRVSTDRLANWLGDAGPVLIGVIVGLPVVLLLVNSFNTAAPGQPATYSVHDWIQAFSDATTIRALVVTLELAVTRTLIALPVSFSMAWLIGRTNMPGRTIIELLCWVGIFLPVLPLTFGWILLADPQFGLINLLLKQLPFIHGSIFNIYGFWGIVWVHLASITIYIQVILLLPALRRIGATLEEAAKTSGADQMNTILRVTMPVLKPAVLGVALLSLVRGLESFEVELVIGKPAGISVYSTRIYDLFHDQPPQFGEATALGFLFLIIMMILATVYQRAIRGQSFVTVTGKSFSSAPQQLGVWRLPASFACFIFMTVALIAPMTFLVLGSFMRRYGFFQLKNPFTLQHWQDLFADPVFFSSVRNSLFIAASVAVLVIVIYSLVAYRLVRRVSRVIRAVDIMVWVPWGVPD